MKKLQNENFNQSGFFPDTTAYLAIVHFKLNQIT